MERSFVVTPWEVRGTIDYTRLVEEFGLERLDEKMISSLPDPPFIFRRRVVMAHRDGWVIVERIRTKLPFAILTGFTVSHPKPHLGNRLIADMLSYFQRQGGRLYLCIADIESLTVRGVPLDEGRRRALEEFLPALYALGVDIESAFVYFQSAMPILYRLAARIASIVSSSELHDIYGDVTPGQMFASFIQVADILLPQLLEGPIPTVVPVAVDQDTHIRFTRDVAKRLNARRFTLPSAFYTELTPGLTGTSKMSKSIPSSLIELGEADTVLRQKIQQAFTGGRATAEEHRRYGGNPSICTVFALMRHHFITDDTLLNKIYHECINGERLCGECKQQLIEVAIEWMRDLQKKIVVGRKVVHKLLEEEKIVITREP